MFIVVVNRKYPNVFAETHWQKNSFCTDFISLQSGSLQSTVTRGHYQTSNVIIRIIIIPIHPLLTLLCVSGTHADLLSHTQTHHPPCGLSRITQ